MSTLDTTYKHAHVKKKRCSVYIFMYTTYMRLLLWKTIYLSGYDKETGKQEGSFQSHCKWQLAKKN